MGKNPICLSQLLPPNVFLLESSLSSEFARQDCSSRIMRPTQLNPLNKKNVSSAAQLSSTQLSASQTIVSNGDLITKPEWSVARIAKSSTNHTKQDKNNQPTIRNSKHPIEIQSRPKTRSFGFNGGSSMGNSIPPSSKEKERKTTPTKKKKKNLKENPTTRHTHPPHSNSDQLNSHTQKTQTLVTISRISFYFLSVCVCLSKTHKSRRIPACLPF